MWAHFSEQRLIIEPNNLNEWWELLREVNTYKTIGNGFLTWTELQEVVLDVEVAVNNRPLGYIQDDV